MKFKRFPDGSIRNLNLGIDFDIPLGIDLVSELGSESGFDTGNDLGFNTLGSSFEGTISWHKFAPSQVWYNNNMY